MALFHLDDFKRHASSFLKEKLNHARLVFTGVSQIQLLTEEATNEDPWGPETKMMALVADAAFELEEFERIVQVIHDRLGNWKQSWRQLYKTLVLLDYLLTHGPISLAQEFNSDVCLFEDLSKFSLIDEQGVERSSMVRMKADRVLKLLTSPDFRTEERRRVRKISAVIHRLGSSLSSAHTVDSVQTGENQIHGNDSQDVFSISDEAVVKPSCSGAECMHLETCEVQSHTRYLAIPSQSAHSIGEKTLNWFRPYRKTLSNSGFRNRLHPASSKSMHDLKYEGEETTHLLCQAKGYNCSSALYAQESLVGSDIDENHSRSPHYSGFVKDDQVYDDASIQFTDEPMYNPHLSIFPPLVVSNSRKGIQHHWQTARLIECDLKFGKIA
ncbi:hypothetical protein KP509_35G008100 [Ceratopteris richardii]|uniref:ENTH domain-containing protein n=1 Tax=Ceratopteris richardii TaxID=49495 RepID=A0A8T2QEH3_CERRI|nr:hypothetical protein KP509_35G008100 [Ceratopteris richardii]